MLAMSWRGGEPEVPFGPMQKFCMRSGKTHGENKMTTGKLKIAVLGAGNIGGTLGRKWAEAGHQVFFGVNDPNGKNAQKLRSELGNKVTIGTASEALSS